MSRDLIRQGLIKRGFPAHVADGILGNIDVESGFNPGINEIAPVVQGSRGGFGLFQHTGPRRRALEAFAAENNRPLADIDTQLDFMAQELLTTERRAGEALAGATTAEDAARIFSERFLRPGVPHLDRRIASATGGSVSRNATQPEPLLGGQQMAEQPQQRGLRGLLSDPDKRDRLILALEGMTLNPNTALQQAAAQGLQERGQQRQQQAQTNKTTEFLRSRGMVDLAAAVEAGLPASTAMQAAVKPEKAEEFGLTPQYIVGEDGQLQMVQLSKSGQTRVVPLPEGSKLAKGVEKLDLGTGFQWYNTLTGQPIGGVIPKDVAGVEEEKVVGAATGQAKVDLSAAIETAESTMSTIDKALAPEQRAGLEAFVGPVSSRLPTVSGKATNFRAIHNQIKGQTFLTAFERLKGGGQITEIESEQAKQAIARLDEAQTEEAYIEALNELKGISQRAIERAKSAASGLPAFTIDGGDDPLGIR